MVVQHNTLIESSYKMTLTEQRLIRICVTQIRRDNSKNARKHVISVYDYNRTFGLSDTRKELEKASRELIKRYVESNVQHEKMGKRWNKSIISIVESVSFNNDSIMIQFTESIMPLFEDLRGNHTTYELKDIVRLNSVYAVRFFEIFKQYQTIGERVITVNQMRVMFGLEKKYKAHKDFKKRVIDTAVDEINLHSPIRVSYEQFKKGRIIHAYSFKIERKATKLQISRNKSARQTEKMKDTITKALDQKKRILIDGEVVLEINGPVISLENGNSVLLHAVITNGSTFTID
ncbi:MAG: replication initiation protein [Mariprofundaceae bacterium]|nr:replication initiation protein [Mariprofundaceae bacterium]